MTSCGNRRAPRAALGFSALGLALGAAMLASSAHAGDLCDNTNGAGVQSNPPSHRTPCGLNQTAHITRLTTYHWNNGSGAMPGTILLFSPGTGRQWGPFPATGTPGQGGAKSVNWVANVDLTVAAGSYQVIDSDPATWSWNRASNNFGFVRVEGDYVARGPVTINNPGGRPAPGLTPGLGAGAGGGACAPPPPAPGRLSADPAAPKVIHLGMNLCVATGAGFIIGAGTVIYVVPLASPANDLTKAVALCGPGPGGIGAAVGSVPPMTNKTPVCVGPGGGGVTMALIPIPTGAEGNLLIQKGFAGNTLPGYWNLFAFNPITGATRSLPGQGLHFMP